MKTILITGAAGFIGSSLVETALLRGYSVVGYDALTYASNLKNIESYQDHPHFRFVHENILHANAFLRVLHDAQPMAVIHLAAESHVDHSISSPGAFVQTNINGTYSLLNAALSYYESLSTAEKKKFRFIHGSTDEVFGSLGPIGKFSETSPYRPNSPYAASKAAADHLVQAWFHTYGLPTIITHASNNYGPRQFPEKLIPFMIMRALQENTLTIYGKGENVRDWIHAEDYVHGILLALEKGRTGERYCFGGNNEQKNLDVVRLICKMLDQLKPRTDQKSYSDLITFVSDRPGHDFRYAIDDSKAVRELGFEKKFKNFEQGLLNTVKWYLDHLDWYRLAIQK